uniref:Uncharacterized protein n=1 Tax=Rhizophora mucronata TaxID=61149 RepID=A0A2P2QMN7_RHIMU
MCQHYWLNQDTHLEPIHVMLPAFCLYLVIRLLHLIAGASHFANGIFSPSCFTLLLTRDYFHQLTSLFHLVTCSSS